MELKLPGIAGREKVAPDKRKPSVSPRKTTAVARIRAQRHAERAPADCASACHAPSCAAGTSRAWEPAFAKRYTKRSWRTPLLRRAARTDTSLHRSGRTSE